MDKSVAQEATEWVNIAALCDRLHILPHEGGLLDQDEKHIKRLSIVLEHIDDYRELEISQTTNQKSQPHGSIS